MEGAAGFRGGFFVTLLAGRSVRGLGAVRAAAGEKDGAGAA